MGVAMKRIAAVFGAFCLTASAATAADLPAKAVPIPAPVIVNDWSGFYLGGHFGYGWGRDPFVENTGSIFTGSFSVSIPNITVSGIDSQGYLGGFQAGYNWQWQQWVGGLEIDLSATDIKGSNSGRGSASGVDFIFGSISTTQVIGRADKFDLLASARARIGFLMMPNWLLYGTGGLGWTRLTQDFSTTSSTSSAIGTTTVTTSASTPVSLFGWVAGGGVETNFLASNWLFRVEYLHYDFGKTGGTSTTTSTTGAAPVVGASRTADNITVDVVRGGLSYKFGGVR
jgi:outer membrane immunogenic protein